MNLSNALKNLFFALILLQIAPLFIRNIYKQYAQILEPKTKVGVVSIQGSIKTASGPIKQLETFFKDSDIKAIVLKIDSQGGTSGSSQLIYNELTILKKEHPKPVITLVENVCASGAFWIACATDYIIAPGTALVGSIGATFSYLFQLSKFIEQYKIGYQSLKSGAYKGATDPFIDLSTADQAMLQGILEDTYQQFAQAVATARKISRSDESTWANGKLFTAKQALELGLVDELGSASTVTQRLKKQALIEGEIEWVHPSLAASWFSKALGTPEQETDEGSLFTRILAHTCSFLETRYGTASLS